MKFSGILQEIACVLGDEIALKIAVAKGGTTVVFPSLRALEDIRSCWLSDVVGEEKASEIVRVMSTSVSFKVEIPLGPASHQMRRACEIEALLDAGKGIQEIARLVGCHQRTVYRRRIRLNEKRAREALEAAQKRNSPC